MAISQKTSQYLAECLGTFILVFAGTCAIVFNDLSGGAITHVGIALTFGLMVLTAVYTFGEVSGAHINPAVSFSFWLDGRISGRQAICYSLSQLTGALLASISLAVMIPEHPTYGATLPSGSLLQSFMLEIILTWWLMMVVFSVSDGAKEKGLVAGIVVGAVVALEALFAGPISGASMNPARSFGPAVVSGQMNVLWIYFTAPLLGAALAVLTTRLMTKAKEPALA